MAVALSGAVWNDSYSKRICRASVPEVEVRYHHQMKVGNIHGTIGSTEEGTPSLIHLMGKGMHTGSDEA